MEGGWGITGKHLQAQQAGPTPSSLPAAGCDGKNYGSESPRLTAPKSCLSANLDIFSPGLLVKLCFWQPGVTPTLPISSQKGLSSPRLECLETTQGGYESLSRQPEQTSVFCTMLSQRFLNQGHDQRKRHGLSLSSLSWKSFVWKIAPTTGTPSLQQGYIHGHKNTKALVPKSCPLKTELILIGCVQIFTMFAMTK